MAPQCTWPLGQNRIYIHRIWPYIWWFPCQKDCICTVHNVPYRTHPGTQISEIPKAVPGTPDPVNKYFSLPCTNPGGHLAQPVPVQVFVYACTCAFVRVHVCWCACACTCMCASLLCASLFCTLLCLHMYVCATVVCVTVVCVTVPAHVCMRHSCVRHCCVRHCACTCMCAPLCLHMGTLFLPNPGIPGASEWICILRYRYHAGGQKTLFTRGEFGKVRYMVLANPTPWY